MSGQTTNAVYKRRPEFMTTLGLSPPYTEQDVKQAYFQRAKELHPDQGGSAADFHRLHDAFQQAQEYVAFRGDRRGWIASRVNSYIAVQDAIEQLESIGAEVVCDATDWLVKSIGDFAQLTETVHTVHLENSPRGDELLRALADLRPALKGLSAVELPGCQVSDSHVRLLAVYQELRRIDLSRTTVTTACLTLVEAIHSIESIDLSGTRVGPMARWRVWREMKRRKSSLR